MDKIKNNQIPNVCNDIVVLDNTSQSIYSLRTIDNFIVPNHRTTLRSRSIKIQGPKIWKTIPDSSKDFDNLVTFKKQIKFSLNAKL